MTRIIRGEVVSFGVMAQDCLHERKGAVVIGDEGRIAWCGALDALPDIGGFLKSKKKAAGLRFVANDIEWSHGDGPEVRGPAESLVLVMSGRPAGLDQLEGDGLPEMQRRIKAA